MDYKAVIFDIDGTLVHTLPEHRYRVFGETLRLLGRDIEGEELEDLANKFWFMGNRDEFVQNSFGIDPESFWDEFRVVDDPELRSLHTVPYADAGFVYELKKRGYKIGAVTGAPYEISRLNVEKLGQENFDSIVNACNTNGVIAKPHPHGIELCLADLNIESGEAIYVGNGDEDVLAAQAAGVLDVLIDRGEYDFPHIRPSITISSLYDLEKLINHTKA